MFTIQTAAYALTGGYAAITLALLAFKILGRDGCLLTAAATTAICTACMAGIGTYSSLPTESRHLELLVKLSAILVASTTYPVLVCLEQHTATGIIAFGTHIGAVSLLAEGLDMQYSSKMFTQALQLGIGAFFLAAVVVDLVLLVRNASL